MFDIVKAKVELAQLRKRTELLQKEMRENFHNDVKSALMGVFAHYDCPFNCWPDILDVLDSCQYGRY